MNNEHHRISILTGNAVHGKNICNIISLSKTISFAHNYQLLISHICYSRVSKTFIRSCCGSFLCSQRGVFTYPICLHVKCILIYPNRDSISMCVVDSDAQQPTIMHSACTYRTRAFVLTFFILFCFGVVSCVCF